jgi:hypothetical protein
MANTKDTCNVGEGLSVSLGPAEPSLVLDVAILPVGARVVSARTRDAGSGRIIDEWTEDNINVMHPN